MGRLDDLYGQLQGQIPQSAKNTESPIAHNVQKVNLGSKERVVTESVAKPNNEPSFQHRDLGTKKDPTKLRKQVLSSREVRDPIDALLHDRKV